MQHKTLARAIAALLCLAGAGVTTGALGEAAQQGFYVGVAHVAFPGIGRLRPDGKGYRWLPANYTSAP